MPRRVRTVSTAFNPAAIPEELKRRRRWVPWRPEKRAGGDKPTKIPYQSDLVRKASTTDADTWASFEQVVEAVSAADGKYGVGVVFAEGDDSSGVDLDNCRESATGEIEVWAREVIELLDSYTEISPSGTGVKVFTLGTKPDGRSRRGDVEMYTKARFFTVTGDHLEGTPTSLQERSGQLAQVYDMHLADPARAERTRSTDATGAVPDQQFIDRAMTARNGAKFAALWRGDTSAYDSHSEADLALATMLYFQTGDRARVDTLFRQSGLWRPKWDDRHHGDGRSYGEGTLDLACQGPTYSPNGHRPDVSPEVLESAEWPDYSTGHTDMANGQRLARRHGRNLRHSIHLPQPWLVWDGHSLNPNNTGQLERLAKRTALSIYSEAEGVQGDDNEAAALRAAIVKWALKSQAADRLRAMMSLAASEPGISILPDDLDRDPWVFNAANVTIDLRTGDVRRQRREDLLTKISPVHYDPTAACPLWIAFLDRMFARNRTLIDFIQRSVGYSLTGDTSEQVILILYGTGANGKTTFLVTAAALMGDYAQWTEFSTFLLKDRDTIRNDLAALKGVRFVSAAESQEGRRLDETVVKIITGGDAIRARFLNREFFQFHPQFKVFLATNHKPEIRGSDHAIWRRIRLVPFTTTIPEDQQDLQLPSKLKSELPGILNWALEGLADWRENGLGHPDEVRSATEEYRSEQDYLRDYLFDTTVDDSETYVTRKDLWRAYQQWSQENGEKPVGSKTFSQMLVDRGYERGKFGPNSDRGFCGLTMQTGWPRPEAV